MNIENALNIANDILKNNCNSSYQLDSELLMSKIFQKDRKFIILNSKKILSEEKFDQFYNLVKKRSKGEPIAYLLNKKDFWNYEFYIDKGILIPRPDSEIIIEQILLITDHRINLTLHKLEEFLEGEAFDEMMEALTLQAQEESLVSLQ